MSVNRFWAVVAGVVEGEMVAGAASNDSGSDALETVISTALLILSQHRIRIFIFKLKGVSEILFLKKGNR